jgi:predicted Zn-dependent protease with MMP-like domain
MDARSRPDLNGPFEDAIDDALSSLPANLRAAMSNVEIVVEDEPPDGQPLLGLYRGVPLPRRTSTYSGMLPDKISIFGGPITRLAAGDGSSTPRGQARRAPRDRASLRDQRRAVDRARSLLTWC